MRDSNTLYFTPGPVPISDRTGQAMHALLYHKSEQFMIVHEELKASLQKIIKTDDDIVIAPGSGTTGAEIIMRGMVPNGSKILMLVNGRFSTRWTELGNIFGHEVRIITVEWGESFTEETLEQILSTESFHSVWITHTETSTGITIPLERFCSIIRKQAPDTFIIVDAVSSLILENILMQSFGIDCIFSASQKALASPPGACIIALSKRASEHIQDNVEQNKVQASMVHNLHDLIHASRNNTPAFTPPLPILSALHSSCTQILQDETYQNKLMQQAEKIRNMISQWRGCAINHAFHSNGVSIVHHSQSEKIIESLKQKDIIVAGGQEQWKSRVFRIGHMVLYTDAELQRLNHSMLEILEYIS